VYGWNGTFPRDFSVSRTTVHGPVGLAPEQGGGLYVADTGDNRVLHFSGISTTADRVYGQNGSFTNGESYPGDTGMVNPFGVAVDSTGGLYVADTLRNRVLHFGAGSTTADRVYGQTDSATNQVDNSHLRAPAGVAVDKAGGLLVVDSGHNRVLHFSGGSATADRVYGQNGSFTTSTFSPSMGGLYEPYGVAVDSTSGLYISDSKNNRVLHFSGTSTTADRIYGQGGGSINGLPLRFLYPTAVSVDSAGGLYIADSETYRVLHFSGDSTSPDRVYGGT